MWANPKVPEVISERFDQVYLTKSTRYIDDIILTHSSHLIGSIENEKLSFQILLVTLLLLLLLLTNLYTGFFYSHIIFTLGTYIYCYHRSPVKYIKIKKRKINLCVISYSSIKSQEEFERKVFHFQYHQLGGSCE